MCFLLDKKKWSLYYCGLLLIFRIAKIQFGVNENKDQIISHSSFRPLNSVHKYQVKKPSFDTSNACKRRDNYNITLKKHHSNVHNV